VAEKTYFLSLLTSFWKQEMAYRQKRSIKCPKKTKPTRRETELKTTWGGARVHY
jgi:hypothetical protein